MVSFNEASGLDKFLEQIYFDPPHARWVGVEREFFLKDVSTGLLVPRAKDVFDVLQPVPGAGTYSTEFSACQIESQTKRLKIVNLRPALASLYDNLDDVASALGLTLSCQEVGPKDMSTEVYPDPRYIQFSDEMSPEVRLAACRVAGTHVHIGMPDMQTALRAYNRAVDHFDELVELGDGSSGERLRLYGVVAPDHRPEKVGSVQELYRLAQRQGYARSQNLRDWHALVRLTRFGTIEFRMFGSTRLIDRIVGWAIRCHQICFGD